MERQRKYKMFSIIALMFAVVALSIGFAAFQKILNISSSAQVSLPSDDKLKLTLYGINNYSGKEGLIQNKIDYSQLSKEISYSWDTNLTEFNDKYYATIDNSNLSISIETLNFTQPNEDHTFLFLLKNDSDYGVYVSLSDESMTKSSKDNYNIYWRPSCTAQFDTTQKLVDEACEYILLALNAIDYTGNSVTDEFYSGQYKLPAGQYMALSLIGGYSWIGENYRADGPFNVDFEPVKLEFSTTPHEYS